MKNLSLTTLLPLVIILALGLLFFSRPISKYLSQLNASPEKNSAVESLGKVSKIQGKVHIQNQPDQEGRTLKNDDRPALVHYSRLTTERGAKAEVEFKSGYTLEFNAESEVIFEYWDQSKEDSPIYASLTIGDFKLIKKGKLGHLYVVKDGQLFVPENRPKTPKQILTVTASPTLQVPQLDKDSIPDESANIKTEPQASEPVASPKLTPDPSQSSDPSSYMDDTLNNQYIDGIIAQLRFKFQKCQANALRLGEVAKGQIIVAFKITNRGKVEDVRTLQSNIANKNLESCIHSVFLRTKFKAFKGEDIIRSYPLNFE